MVPKRLYMRRFLAVGDTPVEIYFSNKPGITNIKGNNLDVSGKSSNGSGKSVLVEGVIFALTGKTLRKLNNKGLLHNGSDGGGIVEYEYKDGQDEIKIVRTIEPSGCRLYVNGQERTTASIIETKKLIDSIVGLNFETLANILIFGQHNILSFLDATEPEKREIVENLMNLKEYNAFEEVAREKLREMKQSLKTAAEVNTVESNHLSEEKQLLSQQEQMLSKFIADIDREIETIQARINKTPQLDDIKAAWDEYHNQVKKREEKMAELEKATSESNAAMAAYHHAVAAMQTDAHNKTPLIEKRDAIKAKISAISDKRSKAIHETLDPIVEEGRGLTAKIATLENELYQKKQAIVPSENWSYLISSLEKKRALIHKEIEELKQNQKTCPTCKGSINRDQCAEIIAERNRAMVQVSKEFDDAAAKQAADEERMKIETAELYSKYNAQITECKSRQHELRELYKSHGEKIEAEYYEAKKEFDDAFIEAVRAVDQFDQDIADKHQPIIDEKQRVKNSIGARCRELQKVIDGIKIVKPQITLDEMGRLLAQADHDRKLLDEKVAARKSNPYVEMIEIQKKDVAALELKIKQSGDKIAENEKLLPYYEFWAKAMGKEGLKSFIIDQIIPTLNEQIEYWMQLMYQGNISLRFDKFLNVSMYNNSSKNEMIFGQGSGGERRRVDIAVMLGFRQIMKLTTGKDPGVIWLDEIAENLDETGVYSLYDVISELAKTNRVYVITHNPHLTQLMSNSDVITVEKQNGSMVAKC